MSTIGYATLSIIPSFDGITARLTAGLVGPAAAAGTAAGREAGDGFSSGLAGATSRMSTIGQSMTAGISVPVGLLGATAIKMSADFEASMNNVRAISGASGADLQMMTDIARELGATTAFSATEAADALGFLAQAGFSAKQATEALPGVLDLAAASGMGLADAADIASNILNGYGLEVDQMARVSDVLAKASAATNSDVYSLGESFKYVAPTANAAGLSFEETAAAIGLLGNAGVKGSEAGTSLNSAIASLLKPSGEAADTLTRLGVSATDSEGNLRSLTDILGDLEAGGATVKDMMTIFGLEAGPRMQALLSQGSGALEDLTTQLGDAGGTAEQMADIRMEGFSGGLKELQSAFEGLMLAVGDSGLLEWATDTVKGLTSLTTSLGESNPEMLKWATVIGGVLIVAGPLIAITGRMISAIASFGRGTAAAVGGTARFVGGLVRGSAALGENASAAARAGAGIRGFGAAIGRGIGAAARATASLGRLAGSYLLVGGRAAGAAAKTALFKLGSLASSAATAAASLTRLAGAYLLTGVRAAGAAAKIVLVKAAQLAVKAATIAWTGVQWALNAALNANPIGLIVLAIAALVAGFIWAYNESETFRDIVNSVLSAVGGFFVWIWENAIKPLWDGLTWLYNWVVANWPLILAVLTGPIGLAVLAIVTYWDEIKAFFQAGIDFVVGAVESGIDGVLAAWEWLAAIPGKVGEWFGQAYDWAVGKLSSLVDWVSGVPDAIGDGLSTLVDVLTSPFRTGFNAIAGLWNDTIGSWSISVPDWVPGIGGSTWSMPKIPLLASGGIVPATPGGTLAVIGEGGEDEAVIPLSRLDAMLAARPVAAAGEGVRVDNLNIHAWSDRFDLGQVQDELAANGAV